MGTGDAAVDAAIGIAPGNVVTGQPKDMFVLSADWTHGPYRAGISAKYTGNRFVNFANTWTAKQYILTDINVGVSGAAISDTLKNIDLSVVVNNALDTNYLGGISGQGAWIDRATAPAFRRR